MQCVVTIWITDAAADRYIKAEILYIQSRYYSLAFQHVTMFQAPLFTLFSMAVLSATVSGTCNIGERYGGDWDGVQDHRYRTDDSMEIERSEVIGTLDDVTNVYKCEESDEYDRFFLLLTPDRSGYNCMGFNAMADTMVQYTVVTKNGSFEPIEVPAGVKPTLENLCANGNNYAMEAVIDIARRLD